MNTKVITIVVVGLTILAGCSTQSDSGTTSIEAQSTTDVSTPVSTVASVSQTATSSSTPTTTVTSTPEMTLEKPSYPPGVTESQVDSRQLYRNHITNITEVEFTLNHTHESVYTRNNSIDFSREVKLKHSGEMFRSQDQSSAIDHTAIIFRNKSTIVKKTIPDQYQEEPIVAIDTGPSITLRDRIFADDLGFFINQTEFDVVRRTYTESNQGIIILEATGDVHNPDKVKDLLSTETITAWNARMAVTPEGIITNFSYQGKAPVNGEPLRFNYTWDFERKNISLPPAWVERGSQNASRIDVTAGADQKYYEITNTGPQTIPAGATIGAYFLSLPTDYSVLSKPLNPGDSVYLVATGPDITIERQEPIGNRYLKLPAKVQIDINDGELYMGGDDVPDSYLGDPNEGGS